PGAKRLRSMRNDTLPFGAPAALSSHLVELFDVARVHQLKAGGVLFAAGDAGDGCYRLDKGGRREPCRSQGEGDCVWRCCARALSLGNWPVARALLELAELIGKPSGPQCIGGYGRGGAGKRQPRAEQMASAQSRAHWRPARLRSQQRSRAQARNE